MKLTYWVAICLDDSPVYSVRARTKRECIRIMTETLGWSGDDDKIPFAPPKKVTVEYDNGFDLMKQCLSENSGCWEYGD